MRAAAVPLERVVGLAAWSSGFSVMGAEVAAGRLLAPAFGTSTLVWSVLIGGVLGGLALGSIVGGRWSRRPRALPEIFAAMAFAGAMLAAMPALTRPLMRATLASFLEGRIGGLALGLSAVVGLVVLPILVLGAMSPVLLHHVARDRAHVGRVAGRLGALGTLGSLAGTFLCGVVLVPLLGTETTFLVCGGLAVLVGVLGLLTAAGPARWRLAVALGAATAGVLGALPRVSAGPGSGAILERETAHNYLRVVDEAGQRTLYLNEGYAAQTVANLDGGAVLGGVWGYYAVAPAFTKAAPERILVIGLGGGISARDYHERLPGAEVVAVEIDRGVVDVARSHFGLPDGVTVHVEDARAFLARDAGRYDLVVVDAFQFPYVPFQLTTQEFYADVRRHLREGGALMVNVGRKGDQRDVVHAVASTLEMVFPHVSGADVRQTTNSILVATAHPLGEAGGAANVRFTEAEKRALEDLDPIRPWRVPEASRLVLTDDRAPVEWLTHRIVVRELTRMAKGRS
jgi:predicted membrane-bound spermidine synthase